MSKIGRIASVAAMSLLAAALFSHGAQATFTVEITQVNNDVVATGGGSLNLTGLQSIGTVSVSPFLSPSGNEIGLGPPGEVDQYLATFTGPSLGSGGPFSPDIETGDVVALAANVEVPHNYVSGDALSDTDVFDSTTLAALGLTPGTYVYTYESPLGSVLN